MMLIIPAIRISQPIIMIALTVFSLFDLLHFYCILLQRQTWQLLILFDRAVCCCWRCYRLLITTFDIINKWISCLPCLLAADKFTHFIERTRTHDVLMCSISEMVFNRKYWHLCREALPHLDKFYEWDFLFDATVLVSRRCRVRRLFFNKSTD